MTRVTMADVALAVGVNKGTVSRALKGDARISSETRLKVWQAAKELGYQLDAVASGLSSRRTAAVGVAVEHMTAPYLGDFLSALGGVLARCKMEMFLVEADGRATSVQNVVQRLEGRKVDGLVWLGESAPMVSASAPLVSVGYEPCEGAFRVSLETARALSRVRLLAAGRPVVYRRGPLGAMAFLAGLEQDSAASGEPFIIWDGLTELPQERPHLVCGDSVLARWLGAYCLRYPARELGVLSGRVMTNILRGGGVRPRITLVQPPLVSPAGELVVG